MSSLGSWADECERADTALAATEAQMGRGAPMRARRESPPPPRPSWMRRIGSGWLTWKRSRRRYGPIQLKQWISRWARRGLSSLHTGRRWSRAPKEAQRQQRERGWSPPKLGGLATRGVPAGRKPCHPSGPPGQEEDEVPVLKVLPARVKERQYDRDEQRRDAVPLLVGEGRMVIKKLAEGAHEVHKIIKFRKQRWKRHATVNVKWETVAAPPSGQELRKIMEATAEADWLQEVRVALGEKVAEIRKLGEPQGDKGLLQARGAAYALFGGATPEWVANQEVGHREEKDALQDEAQVAK